MARPLKTGLDYFPVDTYEDKKAILIFSKYGITGKGLTLALMEEIYGQEGYYCPMTEEDKLFFTTRMRIEEDFFEEFIQYAFRIGLFDKEMYDKYSILTSPQIQEIYFSAVSRRKHIKFNSEYMLINLETDMTDNEFLHSGDSTYKDNADINLINECKSTQSKEKKNTEENSTEKQRAADKITADYIESKPDGRKDNEKETESKENDIFFYVLDIYEAKIGRVSADEFIELSNAVKENGFTIVTDAINEAVKNNAKSMTGVMWYIEKNNGNCCFV